MGWQVSHRITISQSNNTSLKTYAVYEAKSDPAVAEEIKFLAEFGVRRRPVTITVGKAANMDAALLKLQIIKLGCFMHTLNLGAQKLSFQTSPSAWQGSRMWIKRLPCRETVFQVKQHFLDK